MLLFQKHFLALLVVITAIYELEAGYSFLFWFRDHPKKTSQLFPIFWHSLLHSCWHFLTSISQQFQGILTPPYLTLPKSLLWMDPCYSKIFYDNNNINHKNITSTLGEFWTHFIGMKALKVHFFKKMVNLIHSYLIV